MNAIVSATDYAAYRSAYSQRDASFLNQSESFLNGFSYATDSYGYPSAVASFQTVAIALPDTIFGFGGDDVIDAGGVYCEYHYSSSGGFTRSFPSSEVDQVNGGDGDDTYLPQRLWQSLDLGHR